VLRRIFLLKRHEVTGERRKLHSEELSDLYTSSNIVCVIIPRMRWARHVKRIGELKGVDRILVRKHEGNRPLGRHKRRWKDNIKMVLQEVGCWGMTGFIWPRVGTGGEHL
jgi:hypothetical protein